MTKPTRVAFVSLGCAKNLVDSEKMLGQLAEAGCVITAAPHHSLGPRLTGPRTYF